MNYYRKSNPSDVRDLSEQMNAWEASDNPKRHEWALQPDAPPYSVTQHAPEWANGVWVVRYKTAEEIAAVARKTWTDKSKFWDKFTADEKAAILTSEHSGIKVLWSDLTMWPGEVWSDDSRIQQGLSGLVAVKILTESRKTEILTK
jgi:hypothetical protein